VRRYRSAAASARAQFKPAPTDPNDIRGEMRRDQIRLWLRSLPPHQRVEKAWNDETIRTAVMDAGGYLSGLSDQEHAQVTAYHLQTKFGAEIDHLDLLDEAINNVDAALQVARAEVLRASAMDFQEFETLVSPAQERAA
jgi:hypothetical protein